MHTPQTQRLAAIEAEIWHQQHWLPARGGERRGNDRGEMEDELLFTSSIPLKNYFLSSVASLECGQNTHLSFCIHLKKKNPNKQRDTDSLQKLFL